MSVSASNGNQLPVPVLLFVRKLDWGGIERDVTKLAVGLDRARITPHVAVYQGGGLRYDEVSRAGVPILDLEISSFASPRILGSAWQFARYLGAHRIQVVHAFDATAAFAAPLARLLRTPVVFSSTLGHRDLFDPRTRKQQSSLAIAFVDAVVVNCEAMRRHMVNDYHLPPERTILSYNGVDTTEFFPAPGPKPEPVSTATLVIGSVCVLRPEKRMDMLVEAFAPVCRSHPGTKLLIVGGGPELPKLQAKAQSPGHRTRLRLSARCRSRRPLLARHGHLRLLLFVGSLLQLRPRGHGLRLLSRRVARRRNARAHRGWTARTFI